MLHLIVNGEAQEWPEGTTYREIAAAAACTKEEPALLVREGNRFKELHRHAVDGASIEFVTYRDTEGFNAYRRTLVFLMLKAAFDLYPELRFTLHFSLGDGLYF